MKIKLGGFKYQEWEYGVHYRNGTKEKTRHFREYDEAKDYYDQQRKLLNLPVLFKFKPDGPIRHAMRAFTRGDVYWLGWRIRIWLLCAVASVVMLTVYLWGFK